MDVLKVFVENLCGKFNNNDQINDELSKMCIRDSPKHHTKISKSSNIPNTPVIISGMKSIAETIYKIATANENTTLSLLIMLTLLSVIKSGILNIFIIKSNPNLAFLNLTKTFFSPSNSILITLIIFSIKSPL